MVMGFLDDSVIKNPPANAEDARESVSIPESLGSRHEQLNFQ